MQKQNAFEQSYKMLNLQQKEAVDMIEGPVMVVAGPGTGKTQILTLRIANILLKTQVNASNILALTFTQAAATNMRERLHGIIGHEAHHVNIFTFHAFCSHIIEEHPDDFWDMLGMRLADDIEKVRLLEKILDDNDFRSIKPFRKPYMHISAAIRAISELKREGVDPSEFAEINSKEKAEFDAIPDKESTRVKGSMKTKYRDRLNHIERNIELQSLYKNYQKSLSDENVYDYDDLIMSVLGKLKSDQDFRLRIMEKYQYLLVDEHQDSNNAQNKILKYLTSFHENPNIFVVGDEKQAIFRFQGASVENFRSFKELYPTAKIITLIENYRSPQTILDSAIAMLGVEDQGLRAQKHKKKNLIKIIEISNPHEELEALKNNIKKNIEEGTQLHEIAILTRRRDHAKRVLQTLTDDNIPAYADLSEDVLEEPITEKLLILLDAVNKYADDEALFRVLHLDVFGLPPFELYKLSQAASKKRTSLSELLSDVSKMEDLGIKNTHKFYELFTLLGRFYMLSQNESLHTSLHTIVRDSGFLKYMLKSKNPILTTAPIRELFDQVASLDKDHTWRLTDFFHYLEKLKEHNIKIKVGIKLEQKGKVQVLTTHSAKGLEYDIIYVPFATDSVWGTGGKSPLFRLPASIYGEVSDRSETEGEDDERRLFFVALTRAKESAIITYSTQTLDGKATILSRFASSIRPEFISYEVAKQDGESQALAIPEINNDKNIFLEFVRSSFASYGLSVSALNNYLTCPWRYFYVNLVRVPSGKEKSLMFGNAIHNALSMYYLHLKETGEKSCDYLLQAFEKSAMKEDFTTKELGDVLVRGKDILTHYFRTYEDDMSRNVRVKYRIPDVRLPFAESQTRDPDIHRDDTDKKHGVMQSQPKYDTESESIKLTGEIDLVEFTDNSLTNVNVVDWKTGRARSRNDILGKTKSSDGNYYRQLVFYKLLLLLAQPKWHLLEAKLDFVEPDKEYKMHRESFEIDDEDVEKLKATIASTANEINNLSFWDKSCEDAECEWCELRKSLDEKQFENGLF